MSVLHIARRVSLQDGASRECRLLVESQMTNEAWRIAIKQGDTLTGSGSFDWRINYEDKLIHYPPKPHWWSRTPEPYEQYRSMTVQGAWKLEALP